MATINKHGLSRVIKADTMRQVRRECGFGCVICGLIPYQYDHFDPEFADATEHDPSRIALLCTTHHAEKTAGRISNTYVAGKRAHPHNLNLDTDGPRWKPVLDAAIVDIAVCGVLFRNCEGPGLSINGETVISFERGPDLDWLMNGSLCDSSGQLSLRFEANEVHLSTGNWDATLEGKILTLYSAPRRITLQLELDPASNRLALRRLRMSLANGYLVHGDDNSLIINGPRPFSVELRNVELTGFSKHLVLLPIGTRLHSDRNLAVNVPEMGKWSDWTTPRPAGADAPRYSRAITIDADIELNALWAALVSSQRDELLLAACFAPEWIPTELLTASTLNGAELVRLGLALAGEQRGTIKVYPEVIKFLRGKLEQSGQEGHTAALRFLNGCFIALRAVPLDSSSYQRYQEGKAHYDGALGWHSHFSAHAELFSVYCTMLATALRQLGMFAAALHAAAMAVDLAPENDDAQAGLAMTLVDAGRFDEAEEIYRRMINTNPTDSIHEEADLANLLQKSGRADEALELANRVYDQMVLLWGPGDLRTARAMNARASILLSLNEFTGADKLLRESISIFIRLGDRPRTLLSRTNLAAGMEAMGAYDDALVEYREVLAELLNLRGQAHPEIVQLRQNLAFLHVRRGETLEAFRQYHLAIAGGLLFMSPDHPTIQFIASNIRHALGAEGQAIRGEALLGLMAEPIEIREYPLTAHYNHAIVYGRILLGLTWYEEALRLYRAASEAAKRDFGAGSEIEIIFRSNAALCLSRAGMASEAKAEFGAALRDAEAHLGVESHIFLGIRAKLRELSDPDEPSAPSNE